MQRIDILWRDIPSQVLIKRGRDRGKYMLTARFQEAIDRAAMRAGKGGSDAYLEEWRRDSESCQGDMQQLVDARAAELEAAYDDERLIAMIRNKGVEPETSAEDA